MDQPSRTADSYDPSERRQQGFPPPILSVKSGYLQLPLLRDWLQSKFASQQNGHDAMYNGHDGQNSSGVEVDLYALPESEAVYFTGSQCPFQEIQRKSGAEVQFAPTPSAIRGWKMLAIRGYRRQIRTAVRLLCKRTGTQTAISPHNQTFWLQWAETAFPDLESRAYFMPPVFVHRVETAPAQDLPEQGNHNTNGPRSGAKATARPIPAQQNDVRNDAALQRVLHCLQKLSEVQREVLFGLSTVRFGQYLGKPCYLPAATHLPRPAGLPLPRRWRQGNFDALFIHRHYGVVVLDVKDYGYASRAARGPQDEAENIRKVLREAASQLDKAAALLSHILSQTVPGLKITKAIAVPNLTARQVERALAGAPHLAQELCHTLGTTEAAAIPGLCLCRDQLSDPTAPWELSEKVLRELQNWWQRRVVRSRPEIQMTFNLYKTLVARFCGPATTVTVPRTSPPILGSRTLDQAVSLTGEYSVQVTLFPEQVQLVNAAAPRVFVAGPPGTGKTVVLLLVATEWLRFGSDVCIVSTWISSQVACSMLRYLLQQTINTQLAAAVVKPGQLHLLHFDFYEENQVERAVNELSRAARNGRLHVIADEAGPDDTPQSEPFQTFCEKLLDRVPDLHLWAASCYTDNAPAGWHLEYFTRPLRFPSAVAKEVAKASEITRFRVVKTYSQRGVPEHADSPQVKVLYHRRQGHSKGNIMDCVACGREVARFLHKLRIGVKDDDSVTLPPSLQFKDVLVPVWVDASHRSGMMVGLQGANIPVKVMTDSDAADVATGISDVVWVARGDRVCGVERKVVVCLEEEFGLRDYYVRLHFMSRCTSQLVLVSWKPPEDEFRTPICDLVRPPQA